MIDAQIVQMPVMVKYIPFFRKTAVLFQEKTSNFSCIFQVLFRKADAYYETKKLFLKFLVNSAIESQRKIRYNKYNKKKTIW